MWGELGVLTPRVPARLHGTSHASNCPHTLPMQFIRHDVEGVLMQRVMAVLSVCVFCTMGPSPLGAEEEPYRVAADRPAGSCGVKVTNADGTNSILRSSITVTQP